MDQHDTDSVLQALREGNERFVERARADGPWLAELARGQQPVAIVLGCADSRVSPELLFDRGLGELFVVRVAGNVANRSSIASIEFAVAQLGVRLIIVLAHESCGAVEAALEGGDAGKNLGHLLDHIKPAIAEVGAGGADEVARANARLHARRLTTESEVIRQAAEEDGLKIVPAFFRFTGAIEFA